MIADRRVALGVLVGLAIGGAVTVVTGGAPGRMSPPREARTLLPDCDGAIEELAIHYVPGAWPVVGTAYRELLAALPADVTVRVVSPDRAAFDDLARRVGRVRCRLEPVVAGHAMTTWSRDRWLALSGAGRAVTLLSPAEENGAAVWPARAGDALTGGDIARALAGRYAHERSALHYDGGDFVADGRTAFVAPNVARRNVQRTVATRGVLMEILERALGLAVVELEGAPDHHAGMCMMAAGAGRVVVGDPSLARAILSPREPGAPDLTPCGDDWSAGTQASFDAVAERSREAGYGVVRVPVVPGTDGRTYVTYTNVILDERAGARVCYMPVYRRAPALNDAAERAWERLGFEVRRVDCTDVHVHFGSLRCLVNVLSRGGARS